MIRTCLAPAAAALTALLLTTSPAHAGTANRVWVSGHGTDAAGCGAPTAPCRSFQYVVSNVVAAAGEIDVLDPAGYGAVTIPFSLSIVNDGVGAAGVQATSGNAITINAGSGAVTLRGLNIDGLGLGSNGIVFNSGASLTVVNCVLRHFVLVSGNPATGNGVMIAPVGVMRFLISNVMAADNGHVGIYVFPAGGAPIVNGVIDHVIAANNGDGFTADTDHETDGTISIAIANGNFSNNGGFGILISGSPGPLNVSIDNSTVSGNGSGVEALASSTVLLSRNFIAWNNVGVDNLTSPNTFYTYGDNRINGNVSDVADSALSTAIQPR